jgi:hypothetical protein
MPVYSGDINETGSYDISKETNDVGEELHLFVEHCLVTRISDLNIKARKKWIIRARVAGCEA